MLAALIMLGVATFAVAIELLFGLAFSPLVAASGSLGLGDDAAFAGLQAAYVLGLLTGLAVLGFHGWAARAIYLGQPIVRPLYAVKIGVTTVLTVLTYGLTGTGAGVAVLFLFVSLVYQGTLLGLLWLPTSSRRHFRDAVAVSPWAWMWTPGHVAPPPPMPFAGPVPPMPPRPRQPHAGHPHPVASGPLLSGPLLSGPLLSGPLLSGPLLSGPIATRPAHSHAAPPSPTTPSVPTPAPTRDDEPPTERLTLRSA